VRFPRPASPCRVCAVDSSTSDRRRDDLDQDEAVCASIFGKHVADMTRVGARASHDFWACRSSQSRAVRAPAPRRGADGQFDLVARAHLELHPGRRIHRAGGGVIEHARATADALEAIVFGH